MDEKDFTPRHRRILERARNEGTVKISRVFRTHVQDLVDADLVTVTHEKFRGADGRDFPVLVVTPR
ncbi:MAG TPA: hypothetical protein VK735_18775 [Pseudonocardia sp.]|uniref:hypothetical protein n=1 Tax=Pseudonocardia sp. TaxID=60912 RepID=UPI002CF94934|nr:hypothetical protein [Pseudonocardia sp.]HTF49492.1 hypothetical protein [Pseudonocardia sp.]